MSSDAHWDEIWRRGWRDQQAGGGPDIVHAWISVNAQAQPDGEPVADLQDRTDWLQGLCARSRRPVTVDGATREAGVRLLAGHVRQGQGDIQIQGPDQCLWQDGSAMMTEVKGTWFATPNEHFGFVDGIGDPVFRGQLTPETEKQRVSGRGKLAAGAGKTRKWQPLATGEFLLGHIDESQEIAPAPRPPELVRNGSFLVYRKLHQNVGNKTCPIIGDHGVHTRYVIASDPKSGNLPFQCEGVPQFVQTRGGEYFFVLSLTGLRLIALGLVDPT